MILVHLEEKLMLHIVAFKFIRVEFTMNLLVLQLILTMLLELLDLELKIIFIIGMFVIFGKKIGEKMVIFE
jgi:hypothetical protein